MADLRGIWLEVCNVRFDPSKGVEVQLKGDRAYQEQEWWPVHRRCKPDDLHFDEGLPEKEKKEAEKARAEAEKENDEIQREIFSGLDKKRVVLVKLTPETEKQLHCSQIRIQHAEPGSR